MSTGTLELEVLRGKNYPQTGDDPCPCDTQVCIQVLDASSGNVLCSEQKTSIQRNSNAPFYNDTISIRIENAPTKVCLIFKVTEFSRKKTPYVLFLGRQLITLAKTKTKQRFSTLLLPEETFSNQTDMGDEEADVAFNELLPFISTRAQFVREKNVDTSDPYSDVDLTGRKMTLGGGHQLVPLGSQYVWLRLKSDKKWTNAFHSQLAAVWKSHSALDAEEQGSLKPRKSNVRGSQAATANELDSVRTLGDIILKKWCCRRTHQILTRLCLTAEKYGNKTADLTFTLQEEIEFRTQKKERSVLLEGICRAKLEDAGTDRLRDCLNRVWVLFTTGIDNDPAGQRALSYDIRKAMYDAQFLNDDAIVLQACLLNAFVPSLKYEVCQSIAESDFNAKPLEKLRDLTGFEASHKRLTPAQQQFTHVLIAFLGSLLDSLTEVELVKAITVFKSAVSDAQQRISKGAKNTIIAHKRQDDISYLKGDGIHIEHLDKLGRRKETPMFT